VGRLRTALEGRKAPRAHPVARGIRLLGAAGILLFFAAAFTPLANVVNARMGGTPRLEPAEAIVVVGRGGADADGVLTNRSMRRTLSGIELHRRRLAPLLVFSGSVDEVAARVKLARALGVPADGIVQVGATHTTREEAGSLGRLLPLRGVRRVLLVADPIDMPRTRLLLERQGLTVLPAPTAGSGSGDPESRLNLLREASIELAAWAYNRVAKGL
jgi:uncharacterized SAM-binding protein YcdF (DUF218 family)